jgi:hypothetical protein
MESARCKSEARAQIAPPACAILDRLSADPGWKAEAVFVRAPAVDDLFPATSDVDLLIFGPVEELTPQRVFLDGPPSSQAVVDITWYPARTLDDPEGLALAGLVAHRLLSSELVSDTTGRAAAQRETVGRLMYQPAIQSRRIAGFLEMGFLTVREIGITWDFPALALFWLQMAHAACVAAIFDGMGGVCPNVYTRPFGYLEEIELSADLCLRNSIHSSLHLDSDPLHLFAKLRHIYRAVSRLGEPAWSSNIRASTRAEYRYVLSQAELDWRIGVAREMAERGDSAAAVWFLRFWAYSLARIPMVWKRAQEGIDVSFLRPERAVRPDLEENCPEILDDLTRILGGDRPVTAGDVSHSLDQLYRLRGGTIEFLSSRGIQPPGLKRWRPHQVSQDKSV